MSVSIVNECQRTEGGLKEVIAVVSISKSFAIYSPIHISFSVRSFHPFTTKIFQSHFSFLHRLVCECMRRFVCVPMNPINFEFLTFRSKQIRLLFYSSWLSPPNLPPDGSPLSPWGTRRIKARFSLLFSLSPQLNCKNRHHEWGLVAVNKRNNFSWFPFTRT